MRNPYVLWIREHGEGIRKPDLIVTGTRFARFRQWAEGNRWADNLPLLYWGPDWREVSAKSRIFMPPSPDDWFGVVAGVPPPVTVPFFAKGDRPDNLLAAAISVFRDMGSPFVWEINPEATAGALAIAAASQAGCAVAFGAQPSVLTNSLSARCGVDVSSRRHSNRRMLRGRHNGR